MVNLKKGKDEISKLPFLFSENYFFLHKIKTNFKYSKSLKKAQNSQKVTTKTIKTAFLTFKNHSNQLASVLTNKERIR